MLDVKAIIRIIEEKGHTCSFVEKSLGFGNGAIRRWETNSPSVNKLFALSNFLNIDINELLINAEKKNESKAKDIKSETELTEEELLLLENFRDMNKQQKREIINKSAVILSTDEKSTSSTSQNTSGEEAATLESSVG